MSISHKDLEFSFRQTIILRRISLFGIPKFKIYSDYNYFFLRRYSLLDISPKYPDRLILSEKARMYLRHKRRDRIRFLIPVSISILALFGGYDVYTIPLLKQILQEIVLLVKTISENLDVFFQMIF